MQGPSSARAEARDVNEEAVLTPLATVSSREGIEPLAARLLDLRAWLGDDLASLEDALQRLEETSPGGGLPGQRVRRAAQHLLGLPGKRIRPLCVLLAARLGGRVMDAGLRDLAVACELVHAATLLHDDVIDDSRERRGAPAARVLFGNSASILAGDHLLVEALRLVQGTGHGALLSDLLDVIARMVAAEALQLERRGSFQPDRGIYLEVIRGKTAALFGWGLRAGGTVAGLSADALAALEQVGLSLGMAFQLVDDVLDLEGDPQVTGKEALVDVREGKLTWPVILASERDGA
ncbi:MAG TPA: polyprenyl synthetase family protein, partial [Myxococcota bacterium]|nr:polyprenyl synthetase family protein [Myxococcota bacterium]